MELREIVEGVGESVIFVCDDEELAKAGREENLEVINPRKEEDKLKLKEIKEFLNRKKNLEHGKVYLSHKL